MRLVCLSIYFDCSELGSCEEEHKKCKVERVEELLPKEIHGSRPRVGPESSSATRRVHTSFGHTCKLQEEKES